MKRVLLPLWLTIAVSAEPPQDTAAAIPALSRMQAGIEKQLASVRKQVAGYVALGETPPGSGLILPWPKAATPSNNVGFHEEIACSPIPEPELERIVTEAAQRQKVSPKLVRAMITQESGGRPCAVSPAGAQGLMQLMPDVQRDLAVGDPFDPRQSVEAGTQLLRNLIDRYAGDLTKALAAYNAGPAAVDRASGIPPIPETINYVAKIVKRIE